MPIVEVTLIEARSADAKRHPVAKVTAAIVEAIGAPREAVRVILREILALHFGVAGTVRQDRLLETAKG